MPQLQRARHSERRCVFSLRLYPPLAVLTSGLAFDRGKRCFKTRLGTCHTRKFPSAPPVTSSSSSSANTMPTTCHAQARWGIGVESGSGWTFLGAMRRYGQRGILDARRHQQSFSRCRRLTAVVKIRPARLTCPSCPLRRVRVSCSSSPRSRSSLHTSTSGVVSTELTKTPAESAIEWWRQKAMCATPFSCAWHATPVRNTKS